MSRQSTPPGRTKADVLAAIQSAIRNGLPPTMAEIQRATGIRSTSTISKYLVRLERDGKIEREPGIARAIRLVEDRDFEALKAEVHRRLEAGTMEANDPTYMEYRRQQAERAALAGPRSLSGLFTRAQSPAPTDRLEAPQRETRPGFQEWYRAYLRSPEWRKKREAVLARDGHLCQSCGLAQATEVHHLSYEHAGDEPLFELVSVCGGCHDRLHAVKKGPKPWQK